MSEQEQHGTASRVTTVSAVQEAAEILALFDAHDPRFAAAFFAADRDVLGAALTFASLAIREAAVRDDVSTDDMREALRDQISKTQSALIQLGVCDG